MKNLLHKLNSGKNSKQIYYIKSLLRLLTPPFIAQWRRSLVIRSFERMDDEQRAYIEDRVNYYCKLPMGSTLPADAKTLSEHKYGAKRDYPSVYFFDTKEYTRLFSGRLKWSYCMGDVIHVPDAPSIIKSRPLCEGNENSVVMKLNKVRHFIFLHDETPFSKKLDIVVFRGAVRMKPGRREFVEKFFDNPLFNIGDVDKPSEVNPLYKREKMTIEEHLNYKFIMALEGNDVASNLKWIMSSNSVAVMPRPTCETWFMEGRLKPNYHYIEVA
ncbi:MAG: glycosyl transferase family 90, partial [Rikenellaceae bacterium]